MDFVQMGESIFLKKTKCNEGLDTKTLENRVNFNN